MGERKLAYILLVFFFIVVPIVVLLMSGCTVTSKSNYGTILPPEQYDHPHPNITEYWLPAEEIRWKCRSKDARACSYSLRDGKSHCIILLVEGMPVGGGHWRHERGHCNGWPPHHPR